MGWFGADAVTSTPPLETAPRCALQVNTSQVCRGVKKQKCIITHCKVYREADNSLRQLCLWTVQKHQYKQFQLGMFMSENMHVRLTGDSKLSLGVSVSVHGCLSLCGPVMDWRPVQGVPRLLPNDSRDGLQPSLRNPKIGLKGFRKWMDGLHTSICKIYPVMYQPCCIIIMSCSLMSQSWASPPYRIPI